MKKIYLFLLAFTGATGIFAQQEVNYSGDNADLVKDPIVLNFGDKGTCENSAEANISLKGMPQAFVGKPDLKLDGAKRLPGAWASLSGPNKKYDFKGLDIVEQVKKAGQAAAVLSWSNSTGAQTITFNFEKGEANSDKGNAALKMSRDQAKIRGNKEVYQEVIRKGYEIDIERGIILKDKTIFIFLDHYGEVIGEGFPTAATDKEHFEFYQVKCLNCEQAGYARISSDGSYIPGTYIDGYDLAGASFSAKSDATKGQSKNLKKKIGIVRLGKWARSNSDVTFTISFTDTTNNVTKEERTVSIWRSFRTGLQGGFQVSTLQNPENVTLFSLNGIDTTLIGDNGTERGLLTIMATFYFSERNRLTHERKLISSENLGFTLGTTINETYKENFLIGLSYEVAEDFYINGGVHYGQRNVVNGEDDFEKAQENYQGGEIVVKKQWDPAWYVGINFDLRVFNKFFTGR